MRLRSKTELEVFPLKDLPRLTVGPHLLVHYAFATRELVSQLGHIDYVAVVIAPSIERYQMIIEELRTQSADEFEFVTFPVSKSIKMPGQSDFRQIVSRIARGDSSEN